MLTVYKTTNLVNGKVYIGKDSKDNPNYLGSGMYIKNSIKKYGRDNFKKEVVAWCFEKEHLNFLEKFYIQFFKSRKPNGYNLTDGGDGLTNPDESVRKKMSFAKNRPEAKERAKQLLKLSWSKPEVRERRLRAMTEAQNRPKVKIDRSKAMIEYWKDPVVKEMRIKAQNRPETKFSKSETLKITNSKLEVKSRRSEAGSKRWSKPGLREEQSRKLKFAYLLKNPKLKPKLCECGCDGLAKPGKRFIHGHNRRGKPKTGGRSNSHIIMNALPHISDIVVEV